MQEMQTITNEVEQSGLNYNLALVALSFACYYLGIFIRKIVIPKTNSPSLGKQFLLGIPVSLVVVSPLLMLLQNAFSGGGEGYSSILITLGLIIEHGMIVNETAVKHIEKLGGSADKTVGHPVVG